MGEAMEEIYLAGGCLWGVQEYVRHLPGVIATQAGRANGTSQTTQSEYDGYAECVRTQFDPRVVTVEQLVGYLFEVIDPYSINKQGIDVGPKYRTGVYSLNPKHLIAAQAFIDKFEDTAVLDDIAALGSNKRSTGKQRVQVEVLLLTNFVKSDDEHQDRLTRCPDDYCHIPSSLLHKYKTS